MEEMIRGGLGQGHAEFWEFRGLCTYLWQLGNLTVFPKYIDGGKLFAEEVKNKVRSHFQRRLWSFLLCSETEMA